MLLCFLLGGAAARAEEAPAEAPAEALPDFRCGGAPPVKAEVQVFDGAEGEIQVAWRFPTREALWGYRYPDPPEISRYRLWLESVASTPQEAPDPSWEGHALEQRINDFVRSRRLGTLRPMNCLEATLLARQISRTGAEGLSEFVAYVLRSEAASETKIYFLAGPGDFPPRDTLVRPRIRQDLDSGWWLYAIIHNHTGPHPAAAPSASDAQYGLSWAEDGARRFIVLNGIEAFDVSAAELKQFMDTARRDGI